ncbi:MAG: nuclear transport factor 2 family protein [Phycisphaerales bacterium]|nr:nuclear transport factor 2 family protein [Phycisphaerales bacterium]
MSNVSTIQEVYAAFVRGDVAWIHCQLADDVRWEYGPTSMNVPWPRRRRGREEVAGFFASLAEMEMQHFQPKDFLEGPGLVVVLLDINLTVRATGRRVVETDELHVWRFDDSGRITHFRHGCDTHLHHLAYNDL